MEKRGNKKKRNKRYTRKVREQASKTEIAQKGRKSTRDKE